MANGIEITPQDAHREASGGQGVLVDVREPWEWAGGYASTAQRISLYDLPNRHAELPRDRTILCICASGARSRSAAEFLRQLGYDARSVAGGTTAWQRQRLPVEVE